MAVFLFILTGVLTGGVGVYFIAWEFINHQFDEYLFFGIFLCLLSFVCLRLGYTVYKINKDIKSMEKEKDNQKSSESTAENPTTTTPDIDQETRQTTIKPSPTLSKPAVPVNYAPKTQPQNNLPTPKPKPKKIYASFPMLQFDSNNRLWFRSYQYDKEIALFDVTADSLCDRLAKRISFKPESDNPADPNAVAAYISNQKVGYIHKDYMQNMVHDWIRRDDLFGAFLSEVDAANNKAIMRVAFYRPSEKIDSKSFPLVKISKKDFSGTPRSENLYLCSAGDIVDIESDVIEDSFVVSCDGNEIGELGTSFQKWADENNYNLFGGIIETIEEEDEKYKVVLRVYGA